MPSSLLVTLQLALAALIVVTTPLHVSALLRPHVLALLLAGGAIGVAALMQNRPGNFNIRPEVKAGARLATGGIYRLIRHPMYSAFLLVLAGLVLAAPTALRFGLLAAEFAVLIAKMKREERYLVGRFAEYETYRHRTWRLIPWLY
jgi:protein-S-isoprenylcysteine O-methyltransferase Ste14